MVQQEEWGAAGDLGADGYAMELLYEVVNKPRYIWQIFLGKVSLNSHA